MDPLSVQYNVPKDIMRRFEEWGEDHVEVVRLFGNLDLVGTPLFKGIPYARWFATGDHLMTLSYYPPFSAGSGRSDVSSGETHIVVRSDVQLTDAAWDVLGMTSSQKIPYGEWVEKYSDYTDHHLKTVRIKSMGNT